MRSQSLLAKTIKTKTITSTLKGFIEKRIQINTQLEVVLIFHFGWIRGMILVFLFCFMRKTYLWIPISGLKRYKILSLIGDGTYGLVYLATNVETGEKVAIKSMKRRYHSWDEVTDLREVKSLKKLHHPNVVKLKEVIRENSRLYFIFEYVRGDLLGLMREKPNEHFPEFWIRSVIQQVLQV